MSTSRHLDKICLAVIALTLVVTILFMNGASLGITTVSHAMSYETKLFDTSCVHTIDIVMDDWDTFIEGCESEEYSPCTLLIDGEKFTNVGLRAKGNTSLSNVSSMGSDRYSFKIEFDQYQEGLSYYGLDKLCLNNLIQDNTMMKDYLVYQMMSEFGVDSPLCSYVYITVNGEDWGLYLAVEAIEDSFLERNYGSESGDLYKPDSMSFGAGRGNGKDFNMDDFDFEDIKDFNPSDSSSSDSDFQPSEDFTPPDFDNSQDSDREQVFQRGFPGGDRGFSEGDNFPGGGRFPDDGNNSSGSRPTPPDFDSTDETWPQMPQGGFGQVPEEIPESSEESSQGNNTEDHDKSFPGNMSGFPGKMGGGMGSDDVKLKYIDDDADSYSNIFDNAKTTVTTADENRLISSLKNLSNYEDLENTVNIEEVIRYFVVHNFVCNGDSYTGSMIHNYYLYEEDGVLSMIPWDYNLAFGAFQSNAASETVNTSIDSPVSGGDLDDRPMLGWIFSDEEYTNLYHELFSEFISEYFNSGKLSSIIEETAELIRPYVESDPTKFCTTEEFETGITALISFVELRAEAVSLQLAGDSTQVDTGDLNLSDMGSMGAGGGPGGSNQNQPGSSQNQTFEQNKPEMFSEDSIQNLPENSADTL